MRPKTHLTAMLACLLLGGVTLSACADETTPAGNICDDMETEYESFSAGLTKIGDNGMLKVNLMAATPAPPDRGDNVWTVQLLDMNDAPLPGARVTAVTPFMPDHGHGTGTDPIIGDTDANGEVVVNDIDFMMAGVWTITFNVDNGGQTDTATFSFCIDG